MISQTLNCHCVFLSSTRPRLWTAHRLSNCRKSCIYHWMENNLFFPSSTSFVRTVYLKVVFYRRRPTFPVKALEVLQLLSILSYQTLWNILSSCSLSLRQRAWGTAATSLTLPCSTQVLTNVSNKVMIWCKFLSAALPPCTELNALVPSKFL